jgi:hypothetical protein
MSEEPEAAPEKSRSGNSSWKDFLSSALLIGAVGAILLAGWILKGDPAPKSTESTIVPDLPPAESAPAAGLAAEAPPAPDPIPAALDPKLERLAHRAADDLGRLAGVRGPWTAQLVVACRPETVDRLVAAARGASQLYVLPAEMNGASCFRVCWGSYGNAKDAAAAADLPKALRSSDRPGAVLIAKVRS